MSSLQTAETLEKGRKQTTIGGGYYASDDTSTVTNERIETKTPYLELSYREGLAENFDAGVKLTIIGSVSADAKYRLIDGKGFDLSVGGGAGYFSMSSGSGEAEVQSTSVDLILPVYASYRLHESFAVYATPRYVYRILNRSGAESSSTNQSLVGGAGGFKIGKDWGVYLEAAYQKDTGSDFALMQYNVSFFWESAGGILNSLH